MPTPSGCESRSLRRTAAGGPARTFLARLARLGLLGALLLATFACGSGVGGATGTATAERPVISVQPQPCAVIAEQRAVFNVTASGTAPLSYQWRRKGTVISGATFSSYTTPATVDSDHGSLYQVTVSNAGGSVDSNSAMLTVNPRPAGYIPPGLRPQPVPSPEIYPGGQTIYVAPATLSGSGTLDSPLNSIQAGLDLAQPGDTVRVLPGVYPITLRIATVRAATADRRISLVAHNPQDRPILERSGGYGGELLLIKHPYVLVDGFVMDGNYTSEDYNHSYPNGEDAHGVLATHVANLTLRNLDIYHCSGDSIQVDPDITNRAKTKLWSNVDVDNCRLWTGPLAEDSASFLAGQNVGENGIDTKTFENEPIVNRPRMTVRNIEAFGWEQNTYMSNRAAFNIKYNVDWVIDGVHAYGSDIAFRLRGDWENLAQGYATLTLMIS